MHPVILLFAFNLLSVIFKYISVMGTNATSVFIDMLNDLGDVVGLGLLMLGLSFEKKKSNIMYPFGRRRALYVTGLLSIMMFSGLIFAVAIYKTMNILFEPVVLVVKPYALYLFSLAFIVNIIGLTLIITYTYVRRGGNDPTLTGGLIDSISDVCGSALALGTLILRIPILDVAGSLVLSGVILISAITVGYRYFQVLIGRAPPKEVLKKVIERILSIPEVRDVNIFYASMITEDEYMLILEVEVDKDMEVEDAEKLSAKIEDAVRKEDPRFKYVIVEFVGEKPGPKTYREIINE
ncbi:MAG: cation diffusion facilitator family transporter, partial [Desulfurococcaceae archaeon]